MPNYVLNKMKVQGEKEKVKELLTGKSIVKEIVVPSRIVNIIVK